MPDARPRAAALVAAATAALVLAPAVPASAATAVGPAIALRSSSSSSTSGWSVSVAKPVGTARGDVLVARVANQGDVTAQMSAEGWATVGSTQSAVFLKSVVMVRVATSTEPSSYTFDVSTRSNLVASIAAYDNVDTEHPVDTFAGRVNGFSTALRTPEVKSRVGNALAVWFGTQLYSGSTCPDSVIEQPAGLTEIDDSCLPSTTGLAMNTAHGRLGSAGVVSGWLGVSDFGRTNIAQVLTLRPSSPVQVASRYSSSSTDVGKLWIG